MWFNVTHVESAIHALAEPNVLVRLALAGPPVLAWDLGSAGLQAGLSGLHVTVHFDGISTAAKVRIDPVVTYGVTKTIVMQVWQN